ncbi:MAG TPA: hypothetical protein VFG83_18385, partial [Kofleriaceae bacterium]|nr:hypothetical protein [Kofleriaceae bacterium]
PASYTNCTPRTDSDYLYNVQTRYVDFLKGLKTDSNQIILAAITGKTTNGAVEVMDRFRDQQPADGNDDTLGDVELAPSCSSGTGSAVPPVRIKYLLDQFPDSQTHLAEICQADLSGPIRDIAEVFAAKIGNTCLPGDLVDTDPAAGGIQPQCVVTETVGGEDTQFPLCDADNSNTPCYRVEMSAECDPADYPTQLQVVIERGGTTPPASASLNLTCAVNG